MVTVEVCGVGSVKIIFILIGSWQFVLNEGNLREARIFSRNSRWGRGFLFGKLCFWPYIQLCMKQTFSRSANVVRCPQGYKISALCNRPSCSRY